MKEAMRSFETSVLTTDTWRTIQEGGIRHSQSSENLKSSTQLLFPEFAPSVPHTAPDSRFS
jgi:hypothetical protein